MDKRIRILVAEEDSSFLKMMEDSLKTSGSLYQIERVSSGAECLCSASICFVGCFIKGFRGMSRENINANKFMIHSIDFTLMVFSIIAIFLFILGLYVSPRSSAAAVHLIMGGEFTLLFWGVVVGVGILVPLAFEVYELIPHYIKQVELRDHNPWISGIITLSVLIGGFALRYVVIYAGQMAQVIS